MTEAEKYRAIKEIWDDCSATMNQVTDKINEIVYHIETIKEEN